VKSEDWKIAGDRVIPNHAIVKVGNPQQNGDKQLDERSLFILILSAAMAGMIMLLGIAF